MPRREVALKTGHFYHIYNRGVDREPIFFERDNYVYFLCKLREFVAGASSSPAARSSRATAHPADIIAYCLMPNHYHLLVHLRTDHFSSPMQSFGQAYTNAINKRRKRIGPLFQGRFQAKLVDADAYVLHLSRYLHLNPVAAGLVKQPEDWEFSSYCEFVGLRDGTLPKPEFILELIGSPAKYRDFVLDGIDRADTAIKHLFFDE